VSLKFHQINVFALFPRNRPALLHPLCLTIRLRHPRTTKRILTDLSPLPLASTHYAPRYDGETATTGPSGHALPAPFGGSLQYPTPSNHAPGLAKGSAEPPHGIFFRWLLSPHLHLCRAPPATATSFPPFGRISEEFQPIDDTSGMPFLIGVAP